MPTTRETVDGTGRLRIPPAVVQFQFYFHPARGRDSSARDPPVCMQSPLERTGTEQYWLRARDVSDSETIAGDDYLREHEVTRPEDVTAADLPPTDSEAVREIDREALEQRKLVGKWQVTVPPDRLEALWPGFVADAEAGTIWAIKAMTAFGDENLPMYEDYILTVYRETGRV